MFNPMEMMKKAAEMQEEMARKQITAEAADGMVRATVNGKLELVTLKIDKTKFDPNDLELLEDVIVAAVHAAQAKAANTMAKEMQKMAADMGIPPGLLDGK